MEKPKEVKEDLDSNDLWKIEYSDKGSDGQEFVAQFTSNKKKNKKSKKARKEQ